MNAIGSAKTAKCFTVCVVTLFLAYYSNAGQTDFDRLYDYYFPRQNGGVRSGYRHYFDKLLSGPPPPASETNRSSQVYYALRGADAAFHAFLHNPDWSVNGAQGEECVYESVLLLLRLGDERFSKLLARKDAQTRTKVGYAIDPQIHWDKYQFPKTRALYSYRYVRSSQSRASR